MVNRDAKLGAILRRQYHIMLTARDSAHYGIHFLPTSRQYNVVLPPNNRN